MRGQIAEIIIVAGSLFDLERLRPAADLLERFGIAFQVKLLEIHKNPESAKPFIEEVHKTSVKVIIAGSSGAAHLPGVLASYTHLPVIGVPIKAPNSIDGLDAIYSILQMPEGVPVATMGLNNAYNAALFAVQILGCKHESYLEVVEAFKQKMKKETVSQDSKLQALGYKLILQEKQ